MYSAKLWIEVIYFDWHPACCHITASTLYIVIALEETATARVAPISDSVIGGMSTSICAIMQANRIFILKDSLFAFSCPRKLNLIWQQWVARRPSALQIHRRKAVIEFRYLKAAVRHWVQSTHKRHWNQIYESQHNAWKRTVDSSNSKEWEFNFL